MLSAFLLTLHIGAGSVALLTALVAVVTAKGQRVHVLSGRVYAAAMTLVFLTAAPLALLGADVFLLLIAFFSFYLVFAGWRFARNRRGVAHPVDWVATGVMVVTGLGMGAYALALANSGDPQWVTMSVFAAIAVALGVADGLYHRLRRAGGRRRIGRHLTNMLAGTIATVTAVLVVNVETNPPWIAWLLPTVVITPLIVWWNIRVARQNRAN
ncbi:MAG: hypothetical protein F4X65_02995 [Chloroflexi bacterium]|nr:hypothetical protein [Chloroflexota bacterium]